MATDEMGFYIPDADSAGTTPRQESVAEKFNSQTKVEIPSPVAKPTPRTTKVGSVENAVGEAITSASSNPYLGAVINPALTVMNWIDDNITEPLMEEAAAPFLTPEVSKRNPQNTLIQNWRLAREYANDVQYGQAMAKPLTQLALSLPTTPLTGWVKDFYGSQPYMDPEFDILDTNEREGYFKDDPVGIAISSGISLAGMAFASKGIGVGTRAVRKGAFGSRVIESEADLAAFNSRLDTAVSKVESGVTTGPLSDALTKYLDDAVKATDSDKLLNNPLVAASNNPNRAATILAEIDNAKDVADYLKAERGDMRALDRLFQSQASAADALNNQGFKLDPLSDFSQVNVLPDAAQASRLTAVLADIRRKNPDLANALDNFAAEKANGIAVSSYQPSRFAGIEALNTSRARMKAVSQFGDAKIFGEAESGWRTRVYQSSIYDRAVRIISWAGSGRPQGHINVSNPRRYEAQYDILSEVNRLDFLKGMKGAELKRSMIRDYMDQTTDVGRAKALERIENRVVLEMAKSYGVGQIRGIDNNYSAYQQIIEWHKGIAPRKQSARQFLNDYDMLVDTDGSLNVVNLGIRANEPHTVPMLDFRALELEVIRQVRRSTTYGENPISAGTAAKASLSRASMGVGTFLDIANMVFSNLNLLRLAYIPKNSIVDPYARAAMDTETVFGMSTGMQGLANIAWNRGVAAYSGGYRAWTAVPRRTRQKELRDQTNTYAAEMRNMRNLETESTRISDALDQAQTRIGKVKSAEKRAALQAKIDAYSARLTEANHEILGIRSRIPALEDAIRANRNMIIDIETKRADIRSKRKYIGQDDFEFDVDGEVFTLKGLANPNIKGSRAYRTEISSNDSFYNATRRSELSNKISASRNTWVTIRRDDWAQYSNALTHIANRQLRNELEELGGMALRGESVDSMLNWLYKTADGREYLNRMSFRLKDRTGAGVRQWVEQTREDILALFPDQRARDIILERDITLPEIDAFFRGNPNLPMKIKGPDIAAGISDRIRKESGQAGVNPVSYLAATAGNVSELGWRFLGGFENRLIRNPLFMVYTREAMAEQVRAAKRAGLDVTEKTVHNQIRQQAYRAATERIDQTLYSARRLTNAGYIARYLMAFPSAFYNSQVVAARLILKNPANAFWYSSVIDALDGFNPYEDSDGNVYKELDDVPKGTSVSMNFPLYEALGSVPLVGEKVAKKYKDSMGLYTDPQGGGTKVNPKQLEFMVGDPSVSWIVAIPLSEVIKRGISVGPWKIYGEQVDAALRNAAGDDVYESSILFQGRPVAGNNILETTANSMLPTYLKSTLGAVGSLFGSDSGFLFNVDTFTRDVAANTKLAVRNATRDQTQVPSPMEIIQATGVTSFIKAIVQEASPISISFDPVTRAMTERYDELLTLNNGDTALADDAFVTEMGVENLALLGSSNKNIGGLAATQMDLKILRKHSGLMYDMYRDAGNTPSVAGMLSYGYGDSEDAYDEVAAAIFKNSKFPDTTMTMVERKSVEDFFKDPERRLGWYEMTKLTEFRDSIMEQYDIESTRSDSYTESGLRAWFMAEEKRIEGKYRSWAVDRAESRNAFWQKTFPALLRATDNEPWMAEAAKYGPKWSEIADWTETTRIWHDALTAAQAGAIGEDITQKDLKDMYSVWHYQYVNNASPEFQSFAARWLNFPELSSEDEVIDMLMEATSGSSQ